MSRFQLVSVGDFLVQALRVCAKDKDTVRRVGDGKMHEDQILVGLAQFAQDAGAEVSLVEVVVSNYPLEDRDNDQEKPRDYEYLTHTYIETEGRLLRLVLHDRAIGREKLVATEWPSLQALLKDRGMEYYSCEPAVVEREIEGGEEIRHLVGAKLGAELAAAKLSADTPNAPRPTGSPRL